VQLFAVLNHHREQLDPVPPLPHLAELNLPIALADGVTIPSLDDAAELDGDDEPAQKGSNLSISYIKSMQDSIEIEEDGAQKDATTHEAAKSRGKVPVAAAQAKDQRVVEAETWAARYRASNAKVKASPSSLRAYKLWEANNDLDPVGIAKLLRDPPLQTNTVVSYILEAIRLEKLPYLAPRLRTEILGILPKEVQQYRYEALVRATSQSDSQGF
jgi:exonuclease 3'-5' domain-containing protein 2